MTMAIWAFSAAADRGFHIVPVPDGDARDLGIDSGFQAVVRRDGEERDDVGAAATAGAGTHGPRADERDGAHGFTIQGQEVAVVLEQDHGLLGDAARHGAVLKAGTGWGAGCGPKRPNSIILEKRRTSLSSMTDMGTWPDSTALCSASPQ